MELLLEASPSSVSLAVADPDLYYDGALPLHLALEGGVPDVRTVRALLKACPSSATVLWKGCSLSFEARFDAATLF